MAYLEGKVVAVTGAGRGIGRAVALDAARNGAKVVVNDFGVAMDGTEPSSEVANAVVAEIKEAGGEAVANPSSVTAHLVRASVPETAFLASLFADTRASLNFGSRFSPQHYWVSQHY